MTIAPNSQIASELNGDACCKMQQASCVKLLSDNVLGVGGDGYFSVL